MKLKLVKFDDSDRFGGFSDWYIIERADHDNLEWEERIIVSDSKNSGYCVNVFCKSARLCGQVNEKCKGVSASIEGTSYEMKDIASAIEGRYDENHKRCSIEFRNDKAYLGSPRNDNGFQCEIPLEDVDDLAKQIREILGYNE
jgi:hypothetical protein